MCATPPYHEELISSTPNLQLDLVACKINTPLKKHQELITVENICLLFSKHKLWKYFHPFKDKEQLFKINKIGVILIFISIGSGGKPILHYIQITQ